MASASVTKTAQIPASSSSRPDAKTQRYDRQLRLWAANGQKALEETRICLINGTATGTEILKNLILPGIGSFTVVDGKLVSGTDAGNNFFLTADSLGKPRAECVTHHLKELNDGVRASYESEDPVRIIHTNPDYFHHFELIIATDLDEASTAKLADICWSQHIPFISVRNIGFLGYFRIAVQEHTIVETHPDSIVDLRLDCPFPELEQYANSFNFESMDSMQHGHIPFVVILLKYLKQWKAEHNGKLPQTYAEKNEFKARIRTGMRSSDEENFEEAIAATWRACTETKVPSSVLQLFADPACENITPHSSNFWLLTNAVKQFVNGPGNGLSPLAGALPDMKADSDRYVALQKVYRKKAQADLSAVKTILRQTLQSLGLKSNTISDPEIEAFCKHAVFIKVIRFKSLAEEYSGSVAKEITSQLSMDDESIKLYVAIRAADRFRTRNAGRYPGEHASTDMEEDLAMMRSITQELLSEWSMPASDIEQFDEALRAVTQAGGAELHNMASLMGGLVSQEAIKLVTRQYIPLDNTCIFDGIKSVASVYRL